MWMESALGLCAGCEIYAFLRRRGWIAKDDAIEICAGGVCEAPRPAAAADRAVSGTITEPSGSIPNQRARRLAPNSSFSAAYSREGSFRSATGASPPRKLTSTLLTSPSPNSA